MTKETGQKSTITTGMGVRPELDKYMSKADSAGGTTFGEKLAEAAKLGVEADKEREHLKMSKMNLPVDEAARDAAVSRAYEKWDEQDVVGLVSQEGKTLEESYLANELGSTMHDSETEHKAVSYVKDVVDMNERLRHQNNHLIATNAQLRRVIKAMAEAATDVSIPDLPNGD